MDEVPVASLEEDVASDAKGATGGDAHLVIEAASEMHGSSSCAGYVTLKVILGDVEGVSERVWLVEGKQEPTFDCTRQGAEMTSDLAARLSAFTEPKSHVISHLTQLFRNFPK